MGADTNTFCGCLPWSRRRDSRASSGTNHHPSSATKVPCKASGAKVRGILKNTPEPAPAKWRSQIGASDASSTTSAQEGPSYSINGAVPVSATAFGAAEESTAATAAQAARLRSTATASEVRLSSQPQISMRINGDVSTTGNPHSSVSKGGGGAVSPLPQGDVAFADPSNPAATSAIGTGAGGGGEGNPVSRLQELQERFRHRLGRAASAFDDGAAAGGAAAADDRFRSDQMQCDSFTYSISAQGRRSSCGNGRLGPLPPLPPSPARPFGQANGHGNYRPRHGHAHGHGHGPADAIGRVHGVSVMAAQQLQQVRMQQRGPRKPQDQAPPDKWQKATLLSTHSPQTSRNNSLTTTHIPGSLPSVTQGQVSPGAMRIHPPAAPAWEEASAAAAAPVPLSVVSPWPAQGLPWSGAEALQAPGTELPPPARSSASTAAWGAAAQVQQAEQEQQLQPAAGSGGGDEVPEETANRGHAMPRFSSGGCTDPRASGPQVVRQSNNGGVAHRGTHGPAGYSAAAAAAAMPGSVPNARQLSKKPSSGGSGLRGDRMSSAAILAMEAMALECGEEAHDFRGRPLPSRTGVETIGGTALPRGGASPMRGGGDDASGAGGRLSLPLYDSFAPDAVQAKAPSFGTAPENRSSPGCMYSGREPLAQGAHPQLGVTSDGLPPPPPPQRLQSAPPRDDLGRLGEHRSAPIEPLASKHAFGEGGPASKGGVGGGAGIGAAGGLGDGDDSQAAELTSMFRPTARPSQLRMQAARANEEMLMALLGGSSRALDPGPARVDIPGGGGTASELERFDRVQDAMSRLESILAPPPPT